MEAKSEVDVVISRSQAYLAWPAWAQAAGQAKLQAAQCPGTLAKTEVIYPKNMRAKVAMDFL